MVRQIAQGWGIGGGGITDLELVVVGQSVTHRHVKIARKTILAIGKNGVHLNHAVVDGNHIPNAPVGTNETAVQRILAIVLSQLILNIIQSEFGIGNAVGTTAYHGTQITLAGIVQILVDMVVTQNNILKTAATVGHPKSNHATAVIGDLHRQKTIVQSI